MGLKFQVEGRTATVAYALINGAIQGLKYRAYTGNIDGFGFGPAGEITMHTSQNSAMSQLEALRWIAQTFEESPERITAETSRDRIPAWDSLGVLTLMAGLDQDFGVLLSDAELRPMASVGDILNVLQAHGKISA